MENRLAFRRVIGQNKVAPFFRTRCSSNSSSNFQMNADRPQVPNDTVSRTRTLKSKFHYSDMTRYDLSRTCRPHDRPLLVLHKERFNKRAKCLLFTWASPLSHFNDTQSGICMTYILLNIGAYNNSTAIWLNLVQTAYKLIQLYTYLA